MTIATVRIASILVGGCIAAFALSAPAFAIGGGGSGSGSGSSGAGSSGGSSGTMPTCKKGQLYDKKTKRCVKQSSANVTEENRTDYAYSLAKAGRYEEALAMLDTLKNPNTAEALNYRGYATRKLGRTDEGISYYLKSVELDPNYAQVREYLGEAYVIKGRLDLAKEQLETIKTICGTECEAYRDLNEAILKP
ncbi:MULTISPECIES: tetratricopeptide repeat protein [unclassified Rhizobium]|uniref:tetratricopeptide repeat protein n=1 Tax=unclassified Rhizobium TaxID=2613769 RepID=UPI0010514A6B|nr:MULTISPECIES: tetratricopeptide repeat protein [unclassified Rhizobium]MBB3394002.1 tetratricopeptide (TPR) repeat protein [Rhizobium sp. BK060]MBB4168257.1 tetratricopeptide (TPR) repeat protein [Rhizobium sp. BK538]TCM80685.1 tetratricopeptide repeat protein [Rhizobium sp. BK068]